MGFLPPFDNLEKTNPEIYLFLLCIQASEPCEDPSKKSTRIQRAAKQCANLDYLFRLSQAHSVTPLIYLTLRKFCSEILPNESLERLKNAFVSLAWQSLRQTAELLRVLELFKAHGIQSLSYKGPLLTLEAYGDLGRREFVDLDLFIKFEDFIPTKKLLLRNGFKPELNLPDPLENFLIRRRCEYSFIHETNNIYLELHWLTVPRFFAELKHFNSFFERPEIHLLGGESVKGLQTEDLLLVLCVHGAKHLWHRLKWLCDVDRIIRKKVHLNWQRVLEEANASHVKRIVLTNLQLCRSLLNTPIPNYILELCEKDPCVQRISADIHSLLFSQKTESFGKLQKLSLQAKLVEKNYHKIKLILGTTFFLTEEDVKRFLLPSPLYVLYYPLRLMYLLSRMCQKRLIAKEI